MQVETKAFGTIEVEDKRKIIIPHGLYGFEDYSEYVIIPDEEHPPFYWLQSIKETEIAFILIDPFLFRKDYEVNVTPEEEAEVGLTESDDALIFVIVTIPQDGSPMTANLQGPIVINEKNMKGMQTILSESKWRTKHDIIAELNQTEK
ncbi:MAG: flagellar assembly protein FliW [Treponema sp.]|nr:flagellar assembly protein FliW [Treponema sp.]